MHYYPFLQIVQSKFAYSVEPEGYAFKVMILEDIRLLADIALGLPQHLGNSVGLCT